MALIPWSGRTMPGATLASLRQEMNDLLNRFWTSAAEPFGLAEWSPPVDVSETADAVFVHAEIAGMDPKAVEISVTGDVLTLSGEKKEETEKQERNYVRVERRYGAFSRSIALPAPVDVEKVEAKVKNGVLEICLPKSEEAKSRRVEIKP
jgi:HSP20 family protein